MKIITDTTARIEAEELRDSMFYADLNEISLQEATACALVSAKRFVNEYKELKMTQLEERWVKIRQELLNMLIEYKHNKTLNYADSNNTYSF